MPSDKGTVDSVLAKLTNNESSQFPCRIPLASDLIKLVWLHRAQQGLNSPQRSDYYRTALVRARWDWWAHGSTNGATEWIMPSP